MFVHKVFSYIVKQKLYFKSKQIIRIRACITFILQPSYYYSYWYVLHQSNSYLGKILSLFCKIKKFKFKILQNYNQ